MILWSPDDWSPVISLVQIRSIPEMAVKKKSFWLALKNIDDSQQNNFSSHNVIRAYQITESIVIPQNLFLFLLKIQKYFIYDQVFRSFTINSCKYDYFLLLKFYQ